jgi:N-acetylneuraminic acid mutarotase
LNEGKPHFCHELWSKEFAAYRKDVEMKKIILPVLVLALSHFSMTLAKENTWITKADMPTARSYLSASVVNGKIYVIGGLSNQSIALPTVEMYDPETDTWERKADMPTARMNLSTVVVDGKIYAIGGLPGTVGSAFSIVEEYDPMTDTWTQRADMPTARNGFGACVYNKQIYTIGGHRMEPAGSTAGLTTVEVHDLATDTWTQKANMPTPRTGLSASEVDGVIYAVGGVYTSPWAGLATVEAYDISADIWTQKDRIFLHTVSLTLEYNCFIQEGVDANSYRAKFVHSQRKRLLKGIISYSCRKRQIS